MRNIITILLLSAVVAPTLSGCMPAASTVTVTPVLIKVSEAARPGELVTLQGRYLGGPASSVIRLGADQDGKNGFLIPKESIVSWSDTVIVFKMPAGAPAGGGWLFVEAAGLRSTGLPYSIKG